MVAPGMPFTNPIVGGGNLVIPFIQSPNFVPGVSGWRISRNGDAEFASQTLRGPLIVIDPNTGLVVASISSTGNIAGQYASIENDIILQGQSLGDRLLDGRGLVAFFGTFATPAAPGNAGVFTNTAWFRAPLKTDRVYYIFCTPLNIVSSSSLTRGFQSQWAYTDTGGGAATLANVTQGIAPQSTLSADAFLPQGLLFSIGGTPDVTATFQLQSTQSGTGDLTFNNIGGWNLMCWDVGSFAGAMNNGGIGTAAGATQRTTVYQASASQSYLAGGAQFVSTDLWRSDFGDGKGATTSYCVFPGATIRSDLSGATIQSATLTMFCTTAEESNGSIAFDPDNGTSPPATQPTFTGGTWVQSDEWPNPGWFTFDILGDFLSDIIGGANSMKISAAVFGLAATRFAGASVANRPYITITYTK
jgi:hypothetical protein